MLGEGILSSWAAGVALDAFFLTKAAAVLGGTAREASLTELDEVGMVGAAGTRTAGVAALVFAEEGDDLLPTVTHTPPPDGVGDAYVTPAD